MPKDTARRDMAFARASERATLTDRFNPAMLTTARHALMLSQKTLADQLKISQALVGKWEAGLSAPDTQQVAALAKVLNVRAELLFVDRPRRLASMSDFYHRALARAKRIDVKAIHARCSLLDLQIDRLLDICELPEDRIPDIDPDNHHGDVEQIAMRARTAMGVIGGPIPNVVELIESCGGVVVDRELEVDGVDALCRWVPEMPKLFFINGARPADRIRFSLTHELGHTIMHFARDFAAALAEDQANGFAAAFLMPAQEIKRDFRGHIDLKSLATLKRKWRVSMQAIARRAWTVGVIDKVRYQSICVQISRRGWRKSEPVAIDRESPKQMRQLLQAHLDAGYSHEELAALLFMTNEQLSRTLADHHDAPTWEDDGVRLRLARD